MATYQGSKNLRFTPPRQMVYLFVERAGNKGISTYQILDLMKEYYPKAKPTTVYRALDYLQQTGLIVKIESRSKFVTQKRLTPAGITLFMVCSNCGSISEYSDDQYEHHVEMKVAEFGYLIKNKCIEISVICPDCQGQRV